MPIQALSIVWRYVFKLTSTAALSAILGVFCLVAPSLAQSVPISLKPYADDYKVAVESRDRIAIAKAAGALWRATEDELGDDARTGDMAHLYARRAARLPGSKRTASDMRKAFKRSVELAALSPKTHFDTDVQRRLDWIEAEARGIFPRPVDKDIAALRGRLEAWTTTNTIYHADLSAIDAVHAFYFKQDSKAAIAAGTAALAAYNALNSTGSSRALTNYETLMRAMSASGSSLVELALMAQSYTGAAVQKSKSRRHKIEAITLYRRFDQALMDSDEISQAISTGFIRPVIGELLEAADLDVLKVHPVMAPQAEHSGYVDVEITLLADGRVDDAKVLLSTHKVYEENALAAVKQWHFNVNRLEQGEHKIIERIKFDLYGTYGQRL